MATRPHRHGSVAPATLALALVAGHGALAQADGVAVGGNPMADVKTLWGKGTLALPRGTYRLGAGFKLRVPDRCAARARVKIVDGKPQRIVVELAARGELGPELRAPLAAGVAVDRVAVDLRGARPKVTASWRPSVLGISGPRMLSTLPASDASDARAPRAALAAIDQLLGRPLTMRLQGKTSDRRTLGIELTAVPRIDGRTLRLTDQQIRLSGSALDLALAL